MRQPTSRRATCWRYWRNNRKALPKLELPGWAKKVGQPAGPLLASNSILVPGIMLTVSRLIKSFGGRVLFEDASLQVNRGERIALIGPNGAGKTTLLSILLEMDEADDGEVALQRGVKVGFLPQESAPVGNETVLQVATALPDDPASPLTLIPPSMIGPPEKVHVDWKDTQQPGLVVRPAGKGTVAWIPWDLGALYYRESLPAHAGLFRDVVDRLNPARQLRTNAHPLVEMTWMQQGDRKLLHLINLSGHSQTGYFPSIPMTGIHIEIAGRFKQATSVRTAGNLPVHVEGGYSSFTLPRLTDYELIVLN